MGKVSAAKVDQAVKDAILKGYTWAKDAYLKVKEFFQEEVLSKTWEDFISDSTCAALKALAAKLKVKMEVVDKAVKDAIIAGKSKVKEIYDYCVEYVKSKVQCEDILGSTSCSVIKRVAKPFGVKLQEVQEFLTDLVAWKSQG